MNKSRMEAFSDGVFSIVITLLILDVHLTPGAFVNASVLRGLSPRIASFILSFIVVGVYWVAHHHMLHFIRQVDRSLLWLNLLVLLCVVFIPFPASLLGTGFRNPIVVRLYGLTLIATNTAGVLFWTYAISHPDLITPHVSREFASCVVKVHSGPIIVYAIALLIAGWSTWPSLILYALVPLFFILPNPFLQKRIGAVMGVGR